MEHRWPDAMREARELTPREAAYRIVQRYFEIAAFANEKTIARIAAVPMELVESAARRLEREKKIKRAVKIDGYPGHVSMLVEYQEPKK